MIFVTVGTQLPFERLVTAVDEWAGTHPETEVFIQSGETAYRPRHCQFTAFTEADQWERLFRDAERVVSHAGMGTILKSLDYGKPLVIMPRLAALGEHRNDHQVATAKRFIGFSTIRMVNEAHELAAALSEPAAGGAAAAGRSRNLEALISEIQRFVHAE